MAFQQNAISNDGEIKFIENKKQWHNTIRFAANIPGGKLYLQDQSFAYTFYNTNSVSHNHGNPLTAADSMHTSARSTNLPVDEYSVIRGHNVIVNFEGANETPEVRGAQASSEFYNYYLGNDPSKWATQVKAFHTVNYKNLYDGVDFRIYSTEFNQLKYDFIISPKSNPDVIKLNYQGAYLFLENGNLVVQTSLGKIVENKPYAYQEKDGKKSKVPCEFVLTGNDLTFSFPKGYDPDLELIIDPLLIFSTYSGSFSDNWGNTATFDNEGNLYSGGIVTNLGNGFPITPGAYQVSNGGDWDIGILKYDSTGSQLIYATYLGGSAAEVPHSLIVHQNKLLIFGTTSSPDFPVTANAFQDTLKGGPIFQPFDFYGGVTYPNGSDLVITKLNTDGSTLMASTLLGGTDNDGVNYHNSPLTRNYGDQFRGDINTDSLGNIYVATNTASTDFPIVNGAQKAFAGGDQDAIVFKFNPELSQLEWSTYFGGSLVDAAFSIKLDEVNNVYITGGTGSPDLLTTINAYQPNLSGGIDGFAAILSPSGDSVLSCTYVGTAAYDQAYFIDIDTDNNIYLLGQTRGSYPVSDGVYNNPKSGQFIHKLNNSLTQSMFSTVFGSGTSSPDISPTAFLVNECGNILISGWGGAVNAPNVYVNVNNEIQLIQRTYVGGSTRDLPVTDDADQSFTDGSDFYMMVLEKDARSLLYGTFFGGSASREHVDGGTSRFDKKGIVYQAVCAGCGGNSDFPTTDGAWSTTNNARNCNNAAFKYDLTTLEAKLATNSPEADQPGLSEGCFPLTVMFLNRSIGGESFIWDLGDGTTTTQSDSIIHTYEKPGTYPVVLTAIDENTCLKEDYDYGNITVFDVNFNVIDSLNICFGESAQLLAEGGITYQWSPPHYLDNANIANPVATPDTTTTYSVIITDQNGCSFEDSVRLDVVPEIVMDFNVIRNYSCQSDKEVTIESNISGAEEVSWDFGDGTVSSELNPTHIYTNSGSYNLDVTAVSKQCVKSQTVPINVQEFFIPNVFTPNADGENDNFQILIDAPLQLKIYNRWGKLLFEDEDYKDTWHGEGLLPGIYYYEVKLPDDEICKGWVHMLK